MMDIDLAAPSDLRERIEALLPVLAARHVRLSVSSYRRPGERAFWLAYLYVDGRRHVVGTPDLRHLSLAKQAEDFLRQLHEFQR